jgi:subtilisin family serine protease
MRKTSFILGLCSLAMLTACKKDLRPSSGIEELQSATRSDNPVAQAASDPYASNEVLVKFAKGTSEKGIANALAHIGGNVQEKILTKAMQHAGNEGFYVVHTPFAVLEAVGKMKGVEGVEFAEPNYFYTHDAVSNDAYYVNGSLWGMYGDASPLKTNAFGSQAAEAWNSGKTGSSTVYVGIIDEGANYGHPDLDANFWTNPYDAAGDGIDNDGNGYKDDVRGWDFDGNNNTTYDGTGDDHGTHVSGTIGAEGGNSIGVAGVNWNVTMISAKFLGSRGGTTANAIKAVDYFTDLKTRHNLNIVATNNSWGGGGFSQALQDAIERANAVGILFIAAAGNGNQGGKAINIDSKPSYPASYPNTNIISVAAISSSGAIASFSNYGAKSVDLGAPGVGVYSTLPANTYGSYSGTSMATPHVTGAAALYASIHPGSTAAQIKAAILSSVVSTASLSGKTVTGGRLNVSGF